MVTGRRKNEVVEMVRQEIRRDVWIIPGNRSKNGNVRDVLGLSPTDAGKCWPVGGTTLNDVLARLGVMAGYTDEQTGEPVEVTCAVHNLRRSWANILRIEVRRDQEKTDLMLAHTSQNYDQTSKTYQKIAEIHTANVADGWRRWNSYWRQAIEQSAANH